MNPEKNGKPSKWDYFCSAPGALLSLLGFIISCCVVPITILSFTGDGSLGGGTITYGVYPSMTPIILAFTVGPLISALTGSRKRWLTSLRVMAILVGLVTGFLFIYVKLKYGIVTPLKYPHLELPSFAGQLFVATGMLIYWILWIIILSMPSFRCWESAIAISDPSTFSHTSHSQSRWIRPIGFMLLGGLPITALASFAFLIGQRPALGRELSSDQLIARLDVPDSPVLQLRHRTYRFVYLDVLKGPESGLSKFPLTTPEAFAQSAARALVRHGTRAVKPLTGALSNPHHSVRLAAVRSLGRIGKRASEAIAPLQSLLAEEITHGPTTRQQQDLCVATSLALLQIDPSNESSTQAITVALNSGSMSHLNKFLEELINPPDLRPIQKEKSGWSLDHPRAQSLLMQAAQNYLRSLEKEAGAML